MLENLIERCEEQIAEAIFGSNAIENVGGSLRIAYRICRRSFAGGLPDIEKIDERDEEYAEELAMLTATERQTDHLSIIRSRREIVQHAITMKYIIDMLILKHLPLDEEMILETHKLLMQYSDHEEGSGSYRSSDEAASHGLRL